MSIINKISDIHQFVEDNKQNETGKKRARELKLLAVSAIRFGMKSRDWEEYMKEFAKEDDNTVNPQKLRRLIGEDEAFNKTEWSYETLAYIAANATCDVTTTVGTGNGLTDEMKNNLDDGF